MKKPVIKFYTKSSIPTPEEQSEIMVLEPFCQLIIENAEYSDQSTTLIVDGVGGAVPEPFKHLPSTNEALKTYHQFLEKLGINVGGLAPNKSSDNKVQNPFQDSQTST